MQLSLYNFVGSNTLIRYKKLAKKIPSIGDRLLLYDLLFIDSQPLQAIFNTFSYSLEHEDKALWLKTSPTVLNEHGKKNQADIHLEVSFCRTASPLLDEKRKMFIINIIQL